MNDRDIHSGGTGRVIEATCTRCQSLTVSPRAANRLQGLEPTDVAAILDTLQTRAFGPGSHLVEVVISGVPYRCFVARHKDDSLVLLSIVAPRGP